MGQGFYWIENFANSILREGCFNYAPFTAYIENVSPFTPLPPAPNKQRHLVGGNIKTAEQR